MVSAKAISSDVIFQLGGTLSPGLLPARRAAAAGCPEVRAGLPASRSGALCSCCAVLAFFSLDHKAKKSVSKVSVKEGPFAVGVVPWLVSPAG